MRRNNCGLRALHRLDIGKLYSIQIIKEGSQFDGKLRMLSNELFTIDGLTALNGFQILGGDGIQLVAIVR